MPVWTVPVRSHRLPRRRFCVARLIAAGVSLCAVALVGCQLTSDVEYASPSTAEQNQAVLEIVHNGMTRQQAVDALTREGVQGSFGVSDSVYYCDVWDRGDARHWYLDVALYFDQSGRLYKVGSSRPDIGVTDSAIDP